MFVDEGILIEVPVAVALERLTAQLQIGGLQAAGSAAFNEGQAVLLRAGFAGLTKQVAVQNLPGYFRGDTAVIPIRWTATGPAGDLFPALDANLELDPAEAGTTRLTVHGSYRPPLGRFGAALDQLVLHNAARATIRTLLSHLERAILEPRSAPARSDPIPGSANPADP
jgi:hypothetical protein